MIQSGDEILKNIPKLPGVYQYFDKNNKIIYIGKSVNLFSRVNSYFNGKSKLNFAKRKMVEEIVSIEVLVTNTAVESLLLETTLIKKHKPKYNILMKDDKSHTYIKITHEIFPKVIKTRIKSKDKNSKSLYYGPYTSTQYVNNVLKITKKIFGHRSCNIVFESENKIKSSGGTKIPCIDYHIKRCAGPCLLQSQAIQNYHDAIENIKHFLNGNFDNVIQMLTQKMKDYAQKLMFEEAQKLKLDIESIYAIKQNQIVTDITYENCDVINYLEKYDKYYVSRIEVRNFKISGIYNYELENKLQDLDESIIYFIENTYIENKNKKELILPQNLDIEKELLQELNIHITIPKIGEKVSLLELAYKNAFEFAYKKHLEGLSVKGFTKKDMTDLLDILGYQTKNTPIIFECNDISHISGNHTVASRSVLENGKPASARYRKLKIKTIGEGNINDFDSMREVMTRRLAEIKKTQSIPDLIIIDGGKGQLSSVIEIIEKEKLSLASKINPTPEETIFAKLLDELQLVSLAKKEEELFLPYAKESILIDKESNILRMIQKIRDEAHRFAITFNRDSRIKASKKNILEEIPGIGPKTRSKLLKHYGSVDRIVRDEMLENLLSKTQIENLENHGII